MTIGSQFPNQNTMSRNLCACSETDQADIPVQDLIDLFYKLHRSQFNLLRLKRNTQWAENCLYVLTTMINDLIIDIERWLGPDQVQTTLYKLGDTLRGKSSVVRPIPIINNRLSQTDVHQTYQQWVHQYADQTTAFDLMQRNLLMLIEGLLDQAIGAFPPSHLTNKWRSFSEHFLFELDTCLTFPLGPNTTWRFSYTTFRVKATLFVLIVTTLSGCSALGILNALSL